MGAFCACQEQQQFYSQMPDELHRAPQRKSMLRQGAKPTVDQDDLESGFLQMQSIDLDLTDISFVYHTGMDKEYSNGQFIGKELPKFRHQQLGPRDRSQSGHSRKRSAGSIVPGLCSNQEDFDIGRYQPEARGGSRKVLKRPLISNTQQYKIPSTVTSGGSGYSYIMHTQAASQSELPPEFAVEDQQIFEQEHLAFSVRHEISDISTVSFSQRRYIGFRNRYEFEKKRILFANLHSFSVVGYDHRKHVHELMRQSLDDDSEQEIRFIDFIEDSQPSYLLMLIYDHSTQKTSLKILQFKKTDVVRNEQEGIYEQIETDNRKISDLIKEGVKKGQFLKQRKKSIDNFELVPALSPVRREKERREKMVQAASKEREQAKFNQGKFDTIEEHPSEQSCSESVLDDSILIAKQNSQQIESQIKMIEEQFESGTEMTPMRKETQIINRIKMYPQQSNSTSNSFNESSENRSGNEFSIQKFISANTSGMSDEEFKIAQDLAKPEHEPKVYPFKTDEFGKLQLPENVLKAKLVSLNNNTTGKTSQPRGYQAVSTTSTTANYYLFTVEENDQLTIYKIKAYMAPQAAHLIQNFKMAKKNSVVLDFEVNSIEWIAQQPIQAASFSGNSPDMVVCLRPSFLLTYVDQSLIDFCDERGKLMHRLDITDIFSNYKSVSFLKLESVRLPRLEWSCRQHIKLPTGEDENKSHKEQLIVSGSCLYSDQISEVRPFLMRMTVEFKEAGADIQQDLKTSSLEVRARADVLKVIGGMTADYITCLQYGPYDNGYILCGMASGRLLVYDPVSLDRVKDFHIFTTEKLQGPAQAISSISMEPTELVFVTSSEGNIAALSIIKKEMHYVYLDLGNRQYCTVAIPKGQDDFNESDFDNNPLQPLFDQEHRQAAGLCCM